MPGQRIYYVPPRLVGSIADWSGLNAPDGRSWLLDHAQGLGFNTVWFSPLFETSHRLTVDAEGHPVGHSLYATRNHGLLDPEFSATKVEGDRDVLTMDQIKDINSKDLKNFMHFTCQAQKQGMRVMAMADLVFNHLASDHPVVLREEQEIKDILDRAAKGGFAVTPILVGDAPAAADPAAGSQGAPSGGSSGSSGVAAPADQVVGLRYTEPGAAAPTDVYFKLCRNKEFKTLNIGMTEGYDTAQINYASPAAKEFFVTGKDGNVGYWKGVIDWCLERGLKDFRCDIAYRLPPDWWQELIEHARKSNPEAVFLAETLGGPEEAIKKMAGIRVKDAKGVERPGFDLGMVSNYWWNFTDNWLPDQELPRLRKMAKYGGAASPDNHDTPTTLAGKFRKAFAGQDQCDRHVGDICARNFVVSALIANSVYMQMGYEYCKDKQNGVFAGDVKPQDWRDLLDQHGGAANPLNITARVKAVNALKESLHVENCYVEITGHQEMQEGKLIRLDCAYLDADTGEKKAAVTLVLNKKPEDGPIPVTDKDLLALESSGLQRLGAAGDNKPLVTDVLVYHTPVPEAARAPAAAVNPVAAKAAAPAA